MQERHGKLNHIMTSRNSKLLTVGKGLLFAALSLTLLGMFPFGLMGMIIAAAASVIVVPIFGTLTYLGLERFGKTSLRSYLWAGFGISTVLAVVLSLHLPHSSARMLISLYEIAYVLIGGPLAAWAFWRTLRPDLPEMPAMALEKSSEHQATGVRGLVPERPETRSDPAAPALK